MDLLIVAISLLWYFLADLRPMWRKQAYKEMAVSLAILGMGICLIALQHIFKELPNPMQGIKQLFGPMDSWMQKKMK